ncbi:MAG: sulfatase-like hydrolase/transferase, partial [Verrucomicrobiales bacterium]|nr:sulfatase-like hydrolase/transferase [Verrucomicrobiales bacterium]
MSRLYLSFLAALSAAVAIAEEKPDILMIAIDDLRPMLGCYGDERIQTPNIDKLAASGVVFERAYCQYAKCGTSRLSLMTGLRPGSIGVFSNNLRDVQKFRETRPEIAGIGQWLKNEGGYHTQSWGKIYHDTWDDPRDWSVPSSPGRDREMWEIADPENPAKPTMIAERWDCPVMQSPNVPDDHLFAGRMTADVLAFLRTREEKIDLPVFLAVGYRRPHLPFIAPKKYFDLYQPDDSWLAKNPGPPEKSPVKAWFNSDGYVGGAKRIGLEMPRDPTREEAIAWNG